MLLQPLVSLLPALSLLLQHRLHVEADQCLTEPVNGTLQFTHLSRTLVYYGQLLADSADVIGHGSVISALVQHQVHHVERGPVTAVAVVGIEGKTVRSMKLNLG